MPDLMHAPLLAGAVTITNIPAAVTEVSGTYRIRVDLTELSWIRTGVRVAAQAAAGGTIRVQYSLNESSWFDLGSATISLVGTGTKVTAYEAIPAAARADVFLRVVTSGGNAVDDPQIRGVWVQAW